VINFFARLVNGRGLPELPDDDPSIERRYPKFPFVDHAVIRKMQRKCLMRAEHMREHPELYPQTKEREALRRREPPPRAASPSSQNESWDWTGIEDTAPTAVRRQNGD
jgi:hypothetical protein